MGSRTSDAAKRLLTVIAALLATSPVVARADGGVVRLAERVGPYAITVFTAPALATGMADISVMVQEAEGGRPVVDARVSLLLSNDDGSAIAADATREQAQNRLLYAALVDLASPGSWALRVTVDRGADSVTVATTIPVAPPSPSLLAYWPYLAIPPVAVALFAVNQRSKRRARARAT